MNGALSRPWREQARPAGGTLGRMEEIVIYEKRSCSTCRAALHLLDERGIPYRAVRYHDAPLAREKLSELIGKMGIAPIELLRTKGPAYEALGMDPATLGDSELISLMIEHPDLMQRPILERGRHGPQAVH